MEESVGSWNEDICYIFEVTTSYVLVFVPFTAHVPGSEAKYKKFISIGKATLKGWLFCSDQADG